MLIIRGQHRFHVLVRGGPQLTFGSSGGLWWVEAAANMTLEQAWQVTEWYSVYLEGGDCLLGQPHALKKGAHEPSYPKRLGGWQGIPAEITGKHYISDEQWTYPCVSKSRRSS